MGICKHYKGKANGDLVLDHESFFSDTDTKKVIEDLENSKLVKKIRNKTK
jgi:hypothetical protein